MKTITHCSQISLHRPTESPRVNSVLNHESPESARFASTPRNLSFLRNPNLCSRSPPLYLHMSLRCTRNGLISRLKNQEIQESRSRMRNIQLLWDIPFSNLAYLVNRNQPGTNRAISALPDAVSDDTVKVPSEIHTHSLRPVLINQGSCMESRLR
jgi:hypothetical protein